MFVHPLLGGGEDVGEDLCLRRGAAAENVCDLLRADRFAGRGRVIQQLVGAHIQRRRDVGEHLQTQLGVAGLDVAHVGRRDADPLRERVL